jgi:hypothetical protein
MIALASRGAAFTCKSTGAPFSPAFLRTAEIAETWPGSSQSYSLPWSFRSGEVVFRSHIGVTVQSPRGVM